MEFQIVHLYPDLMNLYGSYANVLVLKRRLEALGHTVRVEPVRPGEPLPDGDFLYMGAGTERAADAALAELVRFGPEVRAAAADGAVMLFAGTAMELLGKTVANADGTVLEGMGLAEFTAVRGARRLTGDVYGHTDLYPEAVAGFMNKCAVIRGIETPLLVSTDMGWGNDAEGNPEGYHWKNVFASELTGPILVKNPRLLEAVADAVCARRGAPLPEKRPADSWAEKAYQVTEEQLRLRCGK